MISGIALIDEPPGLVLPADGRMWLVRDRLVRWDPEVLKGAAIQAGSKDEFTSYEASRPT